MKFPSKLFLWRDQSLYLGTLNKPACVVFPASSLIIGLEDVVQVQSDKNTISSRSILVEPGVQVSINSGSSAFAICFLDALGENYANLSARMGKRNDSVSFKIINEQRYIDVLTHIYVNDITSNDAHGRLCELFRCHSQSPSHTVDKRIAKVIDTIRDNVDQNLTAEQLAESIDLSLPRLFQLFREQVGSSIRRYRLWHRIFCACGEISKTGNAVWSAQYAGFSDAAHFNRTFKKMLGMTPSDLFAQKNGIQVFIEEPK
jgi:AraC-like DNA-binding protein